MTSFQSINVGGTKVRIHANKDDKNYKVPLPNNV